MVIKLIIRWHVRDFLVQNIVGVWKMRRWSFPFPPTLFEVGQVASRGRSRKGFFGLCKLRDQMVNQGFTTFYHSEPLLPQK